MNPYIDAIDDESRWNEISNDCDGIVDLKRSNFDNKNIRNRIFVGVSFDGSAFNSCYFTNCKFQNCSFDSVSFLSCRMQSVSMRECIFTNCSFEESLVSDLSIYSNEPMSMKFDSGRYADIDISSNGIIEISAHKLEYFSSYISNSKKSKLEFIEVENAFISTSSLKRLTIDFFDTNSVLKVENSIINSFSQTIAKVSFNGISTYKYLKEVAPNLIFPNLNQSGSKGFLIKANLLSLNKKK